MNLSGLITAAPTEVSSLIFCSLQVLVRGSFLESTLFRRALSGLWFALHGTKRIRILVITRLMRNSGAAAAWVAREEGVNPIICHEKFRFTERASRISLYRDSCSFGGNRFTRWKIPWGGVSVLQPEASLGA